MCSVRRFTIPVCTDSCGLSGWHPKCCWLLGERQTGPRRKEFSFVVLAGEVEMRYESVSHATAARIAPFPERTDVQWETTNLRAWNSREGTAEQHDLVYEVSWVQFCTLRREVRNRCHMPRSSKRIADPATAMPPEVEEETSHVHQCDLQSPAAKEPVSPCRSSDQL